MGGHARRAWRLARLTWHMALGVGAAHWVLHNVSPRRQEQIISWWTRGLCRIIALRVRVEGRINPRATLFVANHISWLDIPALQHLLNSRVVSKHEVGAWPVFGAMAQRAGTLFLKRGDHQSTALIADHMTWGLLQRKNFLMFPEGTSSDGLSVQHFHARLFQAAIRAHAHVQAVAISYPHAQGVNPLAPFIGSDNLIANLWKLLAEPAVEMRIVFCTPLNAAGLERRKLAALTREQILDQLPHIDQPRYGKLM
ncbi:MAG: lysophospholipid acyltransferase family protein [Pseudomonadota bacterium]